MSDSPNLKKPTMAQALAPIAFLIVLLIASTSYFGDGSSYGPNQIALVLSAMVATLFGIQNGFTWKDMESAMVHGISLSLGAIFILLIVGSLIGTWILAGIVPTMIYYGLQILHPSFFYAASCLVCSLVAISTGSSWTTAGTIGIALIGIAAALDLSPAITAGAIISGAYFGDKLSPLSDTTNLAPAMAGTDLFTHIRHMLWTTIPSLLIAVLLFGILGWSNTAGETEEMTKFITTLQGQFNLGIWLLIPPVLVVFMVMKKVPAFPALLIGALVGGVFAMVFQPEVVAKLAGAETADVHALLKGFWIAMFDGYKADTGFDKLDTLLSRGGMASMLNTVWLIVTAMMFGASMEKTGFLELIAVKILSFAQSTGSLILSTLATCIGLNIIASDQYIAIVLPGRMYRAEFLNRGLHPKNLSRTLEDSGTLTSPLVPWNTCGAYMAGTLGVPTSAYFMFCFFNLLNPVIAAIYGFTGFTIQKLEDDPDSAIID